MEWENDFPRFFVVFNFFLIFCGIDESIFNAIMATRSYDHLRAVFTQYSHISQTDIRRVVASEFSGDIADLHLGLVDCSQNIPGFQADVRSV